MIITLLNNPNRTPEKQVYVQYPRTPPPAEIFGGTWKAIFDEESVFFRTPGPYSLPFEAAAVQQDSMAKHNHYTMTHSGTRYTGHLSGDRHAATTGAHKNDVGYEISPSGAGTPNTGLSSTVGEVENRPKNRTVRVWHNISN